MSTEPNQEDQRRRKGDAMDGYAKERFRMWEQHGQSIMLGLTLAVLTFTGGRMWDANISLTELKNDNKHLSNTISEMKGSLSTMQAAYVPRAEFNALNERVNSIERRGVSRP